MYTHRYLLAPEITNIICKYVIDFYPPGSQMFANKLRKTGK